MNALVRRVAPSRLRDDDGFGLILAVAMGVIAMAVVMTISAIAVNSLKSSHQHVNFEDALSSAEAGIDSQLSLIQAANDQSPPVNYVTPAPCNVSTLPASPSSEQSWAKSALLGLPLSCMVTTPDGQYVAFRPAGKQTVYSMGWSPARNATGAKERMLKAEYLFGPFKPADAILTDGGLNFSGSVTVDYTDPANAASVHSNGSITTSGSGSVTVEGAITASGSNALAGAGGSCPSGVAGPCTASAPLERNYVPLPRDIYNAVATTTAGWYNLCPDGSVQAPDVGGVPCDGVNVVQASGTYRGWAFTPGTSTAPPVWTLQRQAGTTTYPGVYYVYHGNAEVGDSGNDATTWQITVLAESGKVGDPDVPSTYTNTATCGKYGGNIDWRLFTIQNYLQGTVFDAEGTLSGTANTDAGDGLFAAGDNVNLQSSSNTLTGAIVAGNSCPAAGGNNIQGATVHYDRDAQVPVSSLIDTTLWLEYVG